MVRYNRGFKLSDMPLEERIEFITSCGQKLCRELGLNERRYVKIAVGRWIAFEEQKERDKLKPKSKRFRRTISKRYKRTKQGV